MTPAEIVPILLQTLVQAASIILLLSGAVAVWVAWKGCRVLRQLARDGTRDDVNILLKSPRVPAVSVVMVARDASQRSRAFARRVLDLYFPHHELVLVLDGVDADDMDAWTRELRLVPSHRSTTGELPASAATAVYESTDPSPMVVLQKEPAGEADAWNAGVNAAVSPVIAFFDLETEFAPESLLRLIRPMLYEPDLMFAVCGWMPPPPASGLAGGIADLETTRLWLGRCAAFAGWKNMLAPVPGSTILVRRDAIIAASGFSAGPLELFLHLQGRARQSEKPYRAVLVVELSSFLAAPRTWSELRQRNMSDQRSISRALRRRKSIMGGRYALGWGLPAISFQRFWRPLLETAAYLAAIAGLALGMVSLQLALLLLLSAVGAGILVSWSSVVFRELTDFRGSDPARLRRLFWVAIVENLGYRQLRNLWLIGGYLGR
jgi:cellulose synthase/poly-beta-1,6-N-acetylglucosamine synthase-like glycosyltransferase